MPYSSTVPTFKYKQKLVDFSLVLYLYLTLYISGCLLHVFKNRHCDVQTQGESNYWWTLELQQMWFSVNLLKPPTCFHWLTHEPALNLLILHLVIITMFLLQYRLLDYLAVWLLWLELFSHTRWWSKTELNDCCVTGGTAVFSQIHSDGHSSWERHQGSVGWPVWVLIRLFLYLFSYDSHILN